MTRIVTLGPEGSYSEEAALEYAKGIGGAEIILLDDPSEILGLEGGADLGLLAIENSLEGSIGHTLDLTREMKTVIRGELVLRIRHFLLGRGEAKSVRRILSHPAALAQCRRFLRKNFGGCELVETTSTAKGAERASQEPESAAVGSIRAAQIYGLKILARDIQDQESYTRFILVGREPHPATGRDKTSIIFAVKDLPGALHRALSPFAERGINLTKIESRPSKQALGEYVFFVDFEGHISEESTRAALKDLGDVSTWVKVLGSYPAAISPEPPFP